MLILVSIMSHERVFRAIALATLLQATDVSPTFSPKNSPNNASELNVPYAQPRQLSEISPQMVSLVTAFETGDISGVTSKLGRSLDWGLLHSSASPTDRNTMAERFTLSLKKSPATCLGYFNAGRSSYGLVMGGLNSIIRIAPASMVIVEVSGSDVAITGVKEMSQKNLDEIKDILTPCRGVAVRPTPGLVPTQTPVVTPNRREIDATGPDTIPADIKTARFAFVKTDSNGERIAVGDLGGGSVQNITDPADSIRDLKAGKNGQLLYSSSSNKSGRTPISKIVSLDTNNKKELQLTNLPVVDGTETCPVEVGNMIYWTRKEATGLGADIYRIKKNSPGIEQITQGGKIASDACLVVSVDGAVALSVTDNGRQPEKIAVYKDISALKRDFETNNLPKLISGNKPIGWLPSGELVFIRVDRSGTNLYRTKVDGSSETKIMDGVTQASLSPDGKWIVVNASIDSSPNGKSYLVSSSGGRPIKLPESMDKILHPTWIRDKPDIVRNMVAIAPGMNSEVVDGRETSGLTDRLFNNLSGAELGLGYNTQDLYVIGHNGGRIENGVFKTLDQDCTRTHYDPETLGQSMAVDIEKILDANPDATLTIGGHSYGGTVAMYAMEAITSGQVDVDPSRVRFFTANSPIRGVGKPFFDNLGELFSESKNTCQILGMVSNPYYMTTPAGSALLNLWDNYNGTVNRWSQVVKDFSARGGEVVSFATNQDCVLSVESCLMYTSPSLQAWVLTRLFRSPLISQEIPGTTTVYRSLFVFGFGHDRYFRTNEGVSTLISWIGPRDIDS